MVLSDHLRIHLLQLSQWQWQEESYGELDRWMYLFTAGQEIDVDDPPAILQSQEMREAMHVLQHFAENEARYLLYQQRLEALQVEATWKAELEQRKVEAEAERRAKEEAQRQAEAERHAKEEAQRREEAERHAKEDAQRREEDARRREEEERREKERLLELLKHAGIDPNQTQDE